MAARPTAGRRFRTKLNRSVRKLPRQNRAAERAAAEANLDRQSDRRDRSQPNTNCIEMNPLNGNNGVYYDSGTPITDMIGATPTELGVSLWFKRGATWAGKFGAIIGATRDYNTWNDGFGIQPNSNVQIGFWVSNSGTNSYDFTIPNDNDWHHLAASWDGANTEYHVWFDGVKEDSSGATVPATMLVDGDMDLQIGHQGTLNVDSNNAYLTGRVDNVGLYNRFFNDLDARYLYNNGVPSGLIGPSAPQGLVSWWTFGDTPGDDATISSGNIVDSGPGGWDLTPTRAGVRTGTSAFVLDVPPT